MSSIGALKMRWMSGCSDPSIPQPEPADRSPPDMLKLRRSASFIFSRQFAGFVFGWRQRSVHGLLTATMRLHGTLRVRPGTGGVLKRAAFGWGSAVGVGQSPESHAMTVWSAIPGASLAATAVAGGAFGASLGGGGVRLGRHDKDGEDQ